MYILYTVCFQVSFLAVYENLTQMAVGFADGSVVVYKGDVTRDRLVLRVIQYTYIHVYVGY